MPNNDLNQEDFQENNDHPGNQVAEFPEKPGLELDMKQRIMVGGLAVFAFLVVVIAIIDLRATILSPMNSPAKVSDSPGEEGNQAACSGGQCADDSQELKTLDTDGDGLSDWDELNVYGTSPYLEDTDGDGFTDKEEIESENNPNCPVGEECLDSKMPNSDIQTGTDTLTRDLFPSGSNEPGSKSGQQADELNIQEGGVGEDGVQDLLQGEGDAEVLRRVLVEAGMDSSVLDQFSDEELMQSYQEILGGE